jgi:PKD repeat protein
MRRILFFIVSLCLLTVGSLSQSASASPAVTIIKVSIAHDIGKDKDTSYIYQMFDLALNYSWTVDNKQYRFEPHGTDIYLLLNKTELDTYDVHIESGIQQTQKFYLWTIYRMPGTLRRITPNDYEPNLIDYIENGHGYIGICGSASSAVPLSNQPPTTFLESWAEKISFLTKLNGDIKETSYIGIEALDEYLHFSIQKPDKVRLATPYLNIPPQPQKIGEPGYFEYFPHYDNCANDQYRLGGFPVNVTILDHNNPIFKDYLGDTIRMRFGGGMSFTVDQDANYISTLAAFPDNANDIYPFIAWHFPFFILRIPKLGVHNFVQWLKDKVKVAYLAQYLIDGDYQRVLSAFESYPADPTDFGGLLNLPDFSGKWFYNCTGWKKSVLGQDIQYLNPHLNNNISLVSFNYPNGDEDGGRVILNGCHPEFSTWNNNDPSIALTPANSDKRNWTKLSLYNGLNLWKKVIEPGIFRNMTLNDTIQLENAWFIRRQTAWASNKTDDTDLPPVYGRSQVVDITPTLQEGPTITLKCCVGKNNSETWDSENLSVYYGYRLNSNDSWSPWTRYSSIHHKPYRFTFDSRVASGNGYYEFCSLFNTTTGTTATTECFPPGADASCYLGGNIIAEYTCDINLPYVDQTINFTSQSLTKEGTHITQYSWSFGNGDVTTGENPYINYAYEEPGVYTVNLTVTNNQSHQDTVRKNIRVLNNPPQTSFNIYENVSTADTYDKILPINTQILAYDVSTDPDGSIVNRSWDFGDTSTSYTHNPTHTYTHSGAYIITLCVTDDDGGTDSRTGNITIYDTMANANLTMDNASAHKWKTIQKAIDNTSTNGIIYVTDGTYHENISIPTSLTILGHDKQDTIIHGKVTIIAPHDYELPANDTGEWFLFMNNTDLLLHCNNDSTVGENYVSSPMIHDYSDYNRTITNHGPTWTTSTEKGTGCFTFDGINDTINLTAIPALASQNATISAWIDWTGGGTGIKPILTQLKTPTQGYSLAINDTTDTPILQLNTTIITSPASLPNGWHNIVGTHNTTTLALYVDGVCTATQALTGRGTTARGFIGYDNASHYFHGKIDEVAIWNRTLTSDEIYGLYNENIGVILQRLTIENSSSYALMPCNHTEILDCLIKNSSIGITINNLYSVRISNCNITNCTTGIRVNASTPDQFNRLRVVTCNILNVTHGIIVNNSNNVTVIHTLIDGSQDNLTFNGGDYQTLFVTDTTTPQNLKPTTPALTGAILGDPGETYQYSARSNDTNRDQLLYLFDWGDGNTSGWQNFTSANTTVTASHSWAREGGYYINVTVKDIFQNESDTTVLLFRTETLPPIIHTVATIPGTVGFGGNVTITANVTDNMTSNYSGIKLVTANLIYPDKSSHNLTLTKIADNTYTLVFTDTWLHGRYNYTIWAMDNAYNIHGSSDHYFDVSANATISVATLQDTYSNEDYVNITDPPNPPENLTLINRGLTWNTYYNTITGQNILQASTAPINYQPDNNTWTPINTTIHQLTTNHPAYSYGYRAGNDHGLYGVYFKPNTQNEWPVAFTYNRSDNPTTHVIRSKLLGVGYVDPASNWSYQYLQGVQSSTGYITNNTITYEDVFTDTDVTWGYDTTGLKEEIRLGNQTKTMLQNHPPSQYGLNDNSSYLVFITRFEAPGLTLHNNSGMLVGNVTVSQGKVWFRDTVWDQLRCVLPVGNAYQVSDESIRHRLTYRILQYNGKYYLFSGLPVSALLNMSFPVVIDPTLQVDVSSNDGYCRVQDSNYENAWKCPEGEIIDTDDEIIVGQQKSMGDPSQYMVYRGYLFFNTTRLPSNAIIMNATLSLHKAADYSSTDFDIIIQNGQPDFPHYPIENGDYNKDSYTGKGGEEFNTADFTSGYNDILLTNHSWLTAEGITKFCVRSNRDIDAVEPTGNEYVSLHASEFLGFGCHSILEITYRNQSKIKNTGSTTIKGYLLMQVQYYDETLEQWIVEDDTVNETSPRTINSSCQLPLDLIFNGLIRASELEHGVGTYRVYAAFRDPKGVILRTDDDVDLVSWWEFTKTE